MDKQIYFIHAGECYGVHNWWILSGPKGYDLELAHNQFTVLYEKPILKEFQQTQDFVDSLLDSGFEDIETVDLFTEN